MISEVAFEVLLPLGITHDVVLVVADDVAVEPGSIEERGVEIAVVRDVADMQNRGARR